MHPVRSHPDDGQQQQQFSRWIEHHELGVVQFEHDRVVDAFDDRFDVDGPEPGLCSVSSVRLQLDRGRPLLRQAVHIVGGAVAASADSHEPLGAGADGRFGPATVGRAAELSVELVQLLAAAQPVSASAQPPIGRFVGPTPDVPDSAAQSPLHGALPPLQQTANIRLAPIGRRCRCSLGHSATTSAQSAPIPTPSLRRIGSLLLDASLFALQSTDVGRSWSLTLITSSSSFFIIILPSL